MDRLVKTAIANTMVSELLAASRQYIKCEERDDALEVCKEDEKLPPYSRVGLFCPPAYPRLRCQAGYWTKKQYFNWEKPLPGLDGKDSFAKHDLDLDVLYSNSIDRYYTMGTDSYSPRGLFAGGQIAKASDMGFLPVAVSKVRTVFPGFIRHHFPFSCGNWASNCTSSFINRINVDLRGESPLRHLELVTVSSRVISYSRMNLSLTCIDSIYSASQSQRTGSYSCATLGSAGQTVVTF